MTMWILWAVLAWLVGSIPLALLVAKLMAGISKNYDAVAYGPHKDAVRLP